MSSSVTQLSFKIFYVLLNLMKINIISLIIIINNNINLNLHCSCIQYVYFPIDTCCCYIATCFYIFLFYIVTETYDSLLRFSLAEIFVFYQKNYCLCCDMLYLKLKTHWCIFITDFESKTKTRRAHRIIKEHKLDYLSW